MARGRRPPSQGWKTFLHNHADGIASMDLFVVPTISFRLLYGLLILHHDRRQILGLGVTAHPTAEWISQQLTEAYGWKIAPRYIIRDRDAVYGDVFIRRLRAMSIRDRPTAPRSPWQNGYALTTLSCSASGIFAICCDLTRPTITRHARTFHSTRTRRGREQYMPLVAFCLPISWRTSSSVCASLISDRHTSLQRFKRRPDGLRACVRSLSSGGATRRPVGASRNDKQKRRVSRLRDACIVRLTRPNSSDGLNWLRA